MGIIITKTKYGYIIIRRIPISIMDQNITILATIGRDGHHIINLVTYAKNAA